MRIEYRSNNSGGDWWLKDDDWYALEKAGWKVGWVKNDEEGSIRLSRGGGRWLGTLASAAEKDFPTLGDAIREWESVTGKSASDEGCNCCGPPHSFTASDENDKYIECTSGEDCLRFLYGDDIPTTLREAVELLKSGR